jgi:hypothetical protein
MILNGVQHGLWHLSAGAVVKEYEILAVVERRK